MSARFEITVSLSCSEDLNWNMKTWYRRGVVSMFTKKCVIGLIVIFNDATKPQNYENCITDLEHLIFYINSMCVKVF